MVQRGLFRCFIIKGWRVRMESDICQSNSPLNSSINCNHEVLGYVVLCIDKPSISMRCHYFWPFSLYVVHCSFASHCMTGKLGTIGAAPRGETLRGSSGSLQPSISAELQPQLPLPAAWRMLDSGAMASWMRRVWDGEPVIKHHDLIGCFKMICYVQPYLRMIVFTYSFFASKAVAFDVAYPAAALRQETVPYTFPIFMETFLQMTGVPQKLVFRGD